jgi:hypothetical protein
MGSSTTENALFKVSQRIEPDIVKRKILMLAEWGIYKTKLATKIQEVCTH